LFDAIEDYFAVVDIVGQCLRENEPQLEIVDGTPFDAWRATVTLHKRVRYVHLNIFGDDFPECIFRHFLNGGKNLLEIDRIGKPETALADIAAADLPGELI